MKLKRIYELAIEAGKSTDPRRKRMKEILEENKKEYEESDKKEFLDKEMLWNPFSDSKILYGDVKKEVINIVVGIDVATPELMLIDRLKEKGKEIDLVFAHHPQGTGILGLYKMIKVQEDVLLKAGIGVSTAEKLLDEPYEEYSRSLGSANYNRAVDSAKILDIPFMCIHTPADNMVQNYLEKLLKKENPEKLSDIIDLLLEEKEYQIAAKNQNGPVIFNGNPNSRAGKIVVDMTGGTEASSKVYQKMEMAGVGTIVGMHMSEEHLKKAKEFNINVVNAGHMASDSLGVNLILDAIEKEEKFKKIIEISGFTRHSRI